MKAWVPLLAYPAGEAPNYKYGYKINAALWGAYLFGIPVIWWFSKTYPAVVRDGTVGIECSDEGKEDKSKEA